VYNSNTVYQQQRVYRKLGDQIIGHELNLGPLTKCQNYGLVKCIKVKNNVAHCLEKNRYSAASRITMINGRLTEVGHACSRLTP